MFSFVVQFVPLGSPVFPCDPLEFHWGRDEIPQYRPLREIALLSSGFALGEGFEP
jgi:hypothetical protein